MSAKEYLVHLISKNEMLRDLNETIMINRNFIKQTAFEFVKNGFNIPSCLDGTQTQEYLFNYFDNFWNVPENRIGNEKLGYYSKKVYLHTLEVTIKIDYT